MRPMRLSVILPSPIEAELRPGPSGAALSPAYPNYLPGARSRQTLRGACGAQGADLQGNSGERWAADHFDQPAVRALEFAVRIEIGGIRAFTATPRTARRDFLEPGRLSSPRRSIIAVRRASLTFLPPSSCRPMSLIRASVISHPRTRRGGRKVQHAAPPRTQPGPAAAQGFAAPWRAYRTLFSALHAPEAI